MSRAGPTAAIKARWNERESAILDQEMRLKLGKNKPFSQEIKFGTRFPAG